MSDTSLDQLQGALFGSLIGDALALGVHWIYNPVKIQRLHDRVTNYIDPTSNQYHAHRKTGDQSHYGDQTLILMRSLEGGTGFSLPDFANRWQKLWPNYAGYVDGATRETLSNLEAGKAIESAGSASNDLSGAARIAPLMVALSKRSEEEVIAAARAQTAFTHADPGVVDAAEFFARLTRAVLAGDSLDDATNSAAEAMTTQALDATGYLETVRSKLELTAAEALPDFGLTCHLPDAFPATLFLILKHGNDLETALIENAMAGGDSAARGLLVGMVLGAMQGFQKIPTRWVIGLNATDEVRARLASQDCQCGADAVPDPEPGTNKIEFTNREGHQLAARLEWPPHGVKPKAVAIFAHCFTCSKDLPATTRIARALANRGFAVLRFDFTGLGSSDGDFANTNFSSNVEDLVSAAEHLKQTVGTPTLLIGHSLGGAAVIAAASRIEGIQGIVTIAAPSEPSHIGHILEDQLEKMERDGEVEVEIGGRHFTLKKHFLEDIRRQNVLTSLKEFRGSILILHSPLDRIVTISHAGEIFTAAHHPKSFVSLADADHLLTRPRDSAFAAEMIAAWSNHLFPD